MSRKVARRLKNQSSKFLLKRLSSLERITSLYVGHNCDRFLEEVSYELRYRGLLPSKHTSKATNINRKSSV